MFDNLRSNYNSSAKRILELDIEKCFDQIDHTALMKQIVLPSRARNGLFRAIKAGVKGEFPSSEAGTPQGGVISPLLANLVLHGLEEVGYKLRYKLIRGGRNIDALKGFRYADYLVYILKPEDDEKELRTLIDNFLAERGLKVKEAKTKLVKSTEGFEFLGWQFKVRPNGKFISEPSQKAVKRIKEKVKECMKNRRYTLKQRLKKCEQIVRGWRNYNRYCDMGKHNLWFLSNWTYKFINKHNSYIRYTAKEAVNKAFPKIGYKVNSFVKVEADSSPYNGNLIYWAERENKNYDNHTTKALKKQKFKCNACNLKFLPGDKVELHHIDGNHNNWKPRNLEALHRECHQHMPVHSIVRVKRQHKLTE
jgi:retron-type reverse transcriptase